MMKRVILIVCGAVLTGILVLAGLAGYLRHRQTALLSKPPRHGTSFVIEADFSKAGGRTNNLTLLKGTVMRRSSRLGVRVYWEPISESRVRVFADSTDAQFVGRALFRGGILELRLVREDSDKLVEEEFVPAGYEILKHEERTADGQTRIEKIIAKRQAEPGLTGHVITRAMVTRDSLGRLEIMFEFVPEKWATFAEITRQNIGRRLAIVLDGELMSAPRIMTAVESGAGLISGQFEVHEAFELATALEAPLPVPVRIAESKSF